MDALFGDVASLYRLDQIQNNTTQSTAGKADLGPLPQTAITLLLILGVTWVLIIIYALWQKLTKFTQKS